MSNSELEQLRQQHPYRKTPQLARREILSVLTCSVGGTGILLLLGDALANLVIYYQSVWDFETLPFGSTMMYCWLMYVLGAFGIVLFVAGCRSENSCEIQIATAKAAHERKLVEQARAQRDARLLEWQQQPYRLLHCRCGWWKDGDQTVIGIHIEYQDFYGGPRREMYVRLHRVTFVQVPNDEQAVLFHERQSEWDFGLGVTLMLPARPVWLRYQKLAPYIPLLPRLK